MENSEEILAVIKALDDRLSYNWRIEIFDLCITNKRLAIINPKFVKFKVGYWGRFATIQKIRKQDPLEGLTLDELLEKDKSSYAINYDELEWIALNTSLFGSNLSIKGKKIWKLIKINNKQFKQLSQILPRIDVLKGKLEVNQ